jgi:hypothetical protein
LTLLANAKTTAANKDFVIVDEILKINISTSIKHQ